MSEVILGIDPGNNGAIIQLEWRGGDWHLDRSFRLERGESAIAHFFHEELAFAHGQATAYLEKVTGFGGGIGLKLRENYGFLRGCLMMRGVQIVDVRPQQWMAFMGVEGKSQTAQKRQSMRSLAAELQGDIEPTNWNAAAILLAYYGLRQQGLQER